MVIALATAAIGLVTWAYWLVGASGVGQRGQLALLLLVCVGASVAGGRAAWVTSLTIAVAAATYTAVHPAFPARQLDLEFAIEVSVFTTVTALVAYLGELGIRLRVRALAAEHAAESAEASRLLAEEQARTLAEAGRVDQRLRTALETLIDPIEILEAVRDQDGRIVDYRFVYVNPVLAGWLGREASELVGVRVLVAFPTLAPSLKTLWDRVVETGDPLALEGLEMHSVAHGRPRRFDVRGGRFGDGVVFTYRDVTEQFEAAERLRQSERLYRLLAENVSDVVYLVHEGEISWASPSCTQWMGWTPEEMIGRGWDTIIAPEDLASAWTVPARVAAGERVEITARYRPKDGSTHWTRLVCAPYVDEDGRPEGILVSARQVDAEVAAEAALRESHRQRQRLLEQLPVGVFRVQVSADASALAYVSARAAELLRQHAGAVDVAALGRIFAPADLARLQAAGAAAVATDGRLDWEGRLAGVEPTVWLRIRANVERLADGLVLDGTLSDITQEKAWEAHLGQEAEAAERRAEELAAIDRTRSALLAALGHDLRTPLAVVASSASGLRHDRTLTDAERDELLANIEHGAASLADLLTNLLDLSRVEAGSLPVHLGAVDLVEVLEEPLRQVSAGVVLDLPVDLPEVLADHALLERVLHNLLLNADRHRPPGTTVTVVGRARTQVMGAGVEGGRVTLQVIDHGPGVPPERYHEIFEPFQRLDDRTTGGIGLGLSIARAFTEAMGGRLTPSETPGGGLTMTLDLARSVA